jgi:ABC-type glycerol-3-phosphate transport system permease component
MYFNAFSFQRMGYACAIGVILFLMIFGLTVLNLKYFKSSEQVQEASSMTRRTLLIHIVLVVLAVLTLLPFAFTLNNVFRSNFEFYRSFFSIPDAFVGIVDVSARYVTGNDDPITLDDETGQTVVVSRSEALKMHFDAVMRGPRQAWEHVRPYTINSLIVSLLTAFGVCALGSSTAYILARYRFMGSKAIFVMFLATMMFPGVLTLVPSFLLVKELGC